MSTVTISMLGKIKRERDRHFQLEATGQIQRELSAQPPTRNNLLEALAILTEELGEVAKAIHEDDYHETKIELIQVAAVACAIAESFERYETTK